MNLNIVRAHGKACNCITLHGGERSFLGSRGALRGRVLGNTEWAPGVFLPLGMESKKGVAGFLGPTFSHPALRVAQVRGMGLAWPLGTKRGEGSGESSDEGARSPTTRYARCRPSHPPTHPRRLWARLRVADKEIPVQRVRVDGVQSQTPTHRFPPAAATWMMKPRWRAAPPLRGRPRRGGGVGETGLRGESANSFTFTESSRRAEPPPGPREGRARPRRPPAPPGTEPDSSARLRPALIRQTSAGHDGTCSSASHPHTLQKHPGELQNPGAGGEPGADSRAVGVRAQGTWRCGRRSRRAAGDSRASGAAGEGRPGGDRHVACLHRAQLCSPGLCSAWAPQGRVEGPIAGGGAHGPRAWLAIGVPARLGL